MRTWMRIAAAAVLVGTASGAAADCTIWAVEDTSAARQDRERIFANSDLRERDALVAEAAGIAKRRAEAKGLDFVDVFLTRPEDGTDRDFHMSSTTTVWMRYNPGGTPIQDATWSAQALDEGADVEMTDWGTLDGTRGDVGEAGIRALVSDMPAGVSASCSGG